MRGWDKKIIISSLIFTILLFASLAAPASISIQKIIKNDESLGINTAGGSDGVLATWKDDFFDENMINDGLSYNYVIDPSAGTVSMKDTCPVWTDTDFTRMKTVTVTSNVGETLDNYVIELAINYDSDMQPDFDDLRFIDKNGNKLEYWACNKNNAVSTDIFLLIPEISPDEDTFIYMFYGNPVADDESNFENIFTWKTRTDPDIMVSFKESTKGAWDPHVEYGAEKFLVTWEERLGPEDINVPVPNFERTLPSGIHGRLYDSDGSNPNPDPQGYQNIGISIPDDTSYHAENPSIAFGADKFFVVWEQNPANIIDYRNDAEIMGAFVNIDGTVSPPFVICNGDNGQFNPHVSYENNRFFVIWDDKRAGDTNHDLYGAVYTGSGSWLTTVHVTSDESSFEFDSWICSDDNGNFMVIYRQGFHSTNGPFSLYAKRFDSWGNRIGSTITIAQGNSNTDFLFPCISFNPNTNMYLASWNDGDISQDPNNRSSYDGNIWGKLLDVNGLTVKDNFIIQPGMQNIRADVISYFNSLFFVSYDGIFNNNHDILGKLISSEGEILTDELLMSDGSSLNVDWNNLAVGNGRIFATWEDERDLLSQHSDVFGSIWQSSQITSSNDVAYIIGDEQELITEAVVVSEIIDPGNEFYQWNTFDVLHQESYGTLKFDILNEAGNIVLLQDIASDQDISMIEETVFRLRATFIRFPHQEYQD